MHDGAQYDRQGNVLRWMICNRQNSLACLKISNCYNKEMELNILACFPPALVSPPPPSFLRCHGHWCSHHRIVSPAQFKTPLQFHTGFRLKPRLSTMALENLCDRQPLPSSQNAPWGSPEKDSVCGDHCTQQCQLLINPQERLADEQGNSYQAHTDFAFLVYPNYKTSKFLKYKESSNTEKWTQHRSIWDNDLVKGLNAEDIKDMPLACFKSIGKQLKVVYCQVEIGQWLREKQTHENRSENKISWSQERVCFFFFFPFEKSPFYFLFLKAGKCP